MEAVNKLKNGGDQRGRRAIGEFSDHFRILDCRVARTNMRHSAQAVLEQARSGEGGYMCFLNAHTVVLSRGDERLREIANGSFMSVPDGRPLSVIAQYRGMRDVGRVAGPDFMSHILANAAGCRHFFYGSTAETLAKMTANLARKYPSTVIVGSYAPPFRSPTVSEESRILAEIRKTKPDLIWVGLGAPKQEYWMADHWDQLKPAVLLGVGAAFDFYASNVRRAPSWMGWLGLEWLHRLTQEPRRLWRRYLVTNTLFLGYLFTESVGSLFGMLRWRSRGKRPADRRL